jgi:hypothetical protein
VLPIAHLKSHRPDSNCITIPQPRLLHALAVDVRPQFRIQIGHHQPVIIQQNFAVLIRHAWQRNHQVASLHAPDDLDAHLGELVRDEDLSRYIL